MTIRFTQKERVMIEVLAEMAGIDPSLLVYQAWREGIANRALPEEFQPDGGDHWKVRMSCSKDALTFYVTREEAARAADLAEADQVSQEEENRKLVLETIARRVQGKRRAKGSIKPFKRKP